jgi:competence protein ComEC
MPPAVLFTPPINGVFVVRSPRPEKQVLGCLGAQLSVPWGQLNYMKIRILASALLCGLALSSGPVAQARERTLDVYWIDVEGGAATLIVTPEKEAVLIDSGSAGGRDARRIHDAADAAGLKKIDYFILTHFHTDHFGGIAELAQLIPIGTVYDNGIPDTDPDHNPNDTKFPGRIQPYRDMKADKRVVIQPGDVIPLRRDENQDALHVLLHCIGARQMFIPAPTNAPANAECNGAPTRPPDTSDNKNSVVMLLEYGPFRLFAGGDLTWNLEAHLVCPVNLVGMVDVYQVDHHGLDLSNNPLLVRALSPTVTVMSNGPIKGCQPGTFATLSSVPSIQASYQIHRNLRDDSTNNAPIDYIANLTEHCPGNYIRLSVALDGKSYTVSIPGTGHHQTYQTKGQAAN